MSRVILQVPMSKELKIAAEAVAKDYGFSSLQEILRILVQKLSQRELSVTVDVHQPEEVTYLSKTAEKRYKKAVEEIKAGRNIYKPKNKEEFFKMLHS